MLLPTFWKRVLRSRTLGPAIMVKLSTHQQNGRVIVTPGRVIHSWNVTKVEGADYAWASCPGWKNTVQCKPNL